MSKSQKKELQILRDKLREKTQEFDEKIAELSERDSKYLEDAEKVKFRFMQTTRDLEQKNRNQTEAFEKEKIKMATECAKLVKDISELKKGQEKYRKISELKSSELLKIQNKYATDTSGLEASVKQLTELLEKEKKVSEKLTTSLKTQYDEFSLLQKTNEKLEDKIKKIRASMEELRKTKEQLSTDAEQRGDSDRQDVAEKLQKVVDDNISLRQDMHTDQLQHVSNLTVENKQMADEIKELEKTNEKHLNEIRLLNIQLNTHTSNSKLLIQTLKDYEKNREELLERVKRTTDENLKLAEGLGKYKKETERLSKANETTSGIMNEKKDTENGQEEIQKLYAHNKILKKAVRDNESVIVKGEKDLEDARRINESLSKTLKKHSNLQGKIEMLEEENARLKEQLNKDTTQLKEL